MSKHSEWLRSFDGRFKRESNEAADYIDSLQRERDEAIELHTKLWNAMRTDYKDLVRERDEALAELDACRTMGASNASKLAKCIAERERIRTAIEEIRAFVSEQAEDEGLWCIAETAPEAYLQQELRKLHALIERDALKGEGDE